MSCDTHAGRPLRLSGWIGALGASVLVVHRCRSDEGADRAPGGRLQLVPCGRPTRGLWRRSLRTQKGGARMTAAVSRWMESSSALPVSRGV
jgi:hypothetical protein